MNAVYLIAFIGLVVGFFLLFGITPLEFTDGLFGFLTAKPNTLKSQINEATQRKKPNILSEVSLFAPLPCGALGNFLKTSLSSAVRLWKRRRY